ncbi:hypothetical protein PIB30_099740, partial [Stylosanthes scabra]|nr:hypothetical protein [Stylosanthes scabra]
MEPSSFQSQNFPHTFFKDEISYLEHTIPFDLCFKKASMPYIYFSYSWHVFIVAIIHHHHHHHHHHHQLSTMEVCMTDLDPILACKFSRRSNDEKTSQYA